MGDDVLLNAWHLHTVNNLQLRPIKKAPRSAYLNILK